jgi:hypothetical protein
MTKLAEHITHAVGPFRPGWFKAVRLYLVSILVGQLAWEILQLPLYTIWDTASPRAQAFAVAHCTLGDVLIALCALLAAILLAGNKAWPRQRFWRVAGLALLFGVAYTIFSEWLNVTVRASWAYSDRIPALAVFGFRLGLSPVLQWLVVPGAAFAILRASGSRVR